MFHAKTFDDIMTFYNRVPINFSELYHKKLCKKKLLVLVSCEWSQ